VEHVRRKICVGQAQDIQCERIPRNGPESSDEHGTRGHLQKAVMSKRPYGIRSSKTQQKGLPTVKSFTKINRRHSEN
jgi:hypothetical protein